MCECSDKEVIKFVNNFLKRDWMNYEFTPKQWAKFEKNIKRLYNEIIFEDDVQIPEPECECQRCMCNGLMEK